MQTKYLVPRPAPFPVLVWSGDPADLDELKSYGADPVYSINFAGKLVENAQWTLEIQPDGSVDCYLEYDGTGWYDPFPQHYKDLALSFAVGAPVPQQFNQWNKGIDLTGYQEVPEAQAYTFTITEETGS